MASGLLTALTIAKGSRLAIPQIVIGETNAAPPFRLDARVLEEDTYLILSAEPRAREVKRSPSALLREAMDALPKTPGSVLLRAGPAYAEMLAVVHDLELEPSCKEDWVALALRNILAEANRRGFSTIALPVLGAHHGALPVDRFAELLRDALLNTEVRGITRVFLQLPKESITSELSPLEPWIARM